MAEQFTEEEEKLAEALVLADEDLSIDQARKQARERLAKKKQAKQEPTMAEQTIGWNEIEEYLRDLSAPDLQKFNSRYTELYKQLTDPRYAEVVQLSEEKSDIDRQIKDAIKNQKFDNIGDLYVQLTRVTNHLVNAKVRAAAPNRAVVDKSYKVGEQIILWNGRGTIPDKIKEHLVSKGWSDDKSIASKNKKKELLAKIEVK